MQILHDYKHLSMPARMPASRWYADLVSFAILIAIMLALILVGVFCEHSRLMAMLLTIAVLAIGCFWVVCANAEELP